MIDLLALCEEDVKLQHVSNHNGGEYAGPCPSCGGRDRFRVWPEQGRYWCRRCGKRGDTIQYLRDFRGLSFPEAARMAGKHLGPYQPKPAENVLWRYFEEEYEAIRQELNLIEWASLAISKKPDFYTDEERMQWAVSAVKLAEWYAQVETLWRRVEDASQRPNQRRAA